MAKETIFIAWALEGCSWVKAAQYRKPKRVTYARAHSLVLGLAYESYENVVVEVFDQSVLPAKGMGFDYQVLRNRSARNCAGMPS